MLACDSQGRLLVIDQSGSSGDAEYQPWELLAYPGSVTSSGAPQLLDSSTYSNLASLSEGSSAELGTTTGIYARRLRPTEAIAYLRFLAQRGAGSPENETVTVDVALYSDLVLDTDSYTLRSLSCRATLTAGSQVLSSQTKEPFTRTALSGTADLHEFDTAVLAQQGTLPAIKFGFKETNGSGELAIICEGFRFLVAVWQARSSNNIDSLIVGARYGT